MSFHYGEPTYRGLGQPLLDWITLSSAGAGSTITTTQNGRVFLAGNASSGQTHVLPTPQAGFFFRFIFMSDATSAATIINGSSNNDILLAGGNINTTAVGVQLNDINAEAGAVIDFFGISTARYIAVPAGGQLSSAYSSDAASSLAKLWNGVTS